MLGRYSQKELAYLLGVPERTLARWEGSIRTPSVHHAIGLEVALHRLVSEIFSHNRQEWVATISRRAQVLQKLKVKKTER